MNELQITKDLIRALAFFGIVSDWDKDQLVEAYEYLGIPLCLVNETLSEGLE